MQYLRLPKERVGVLIGRKGEIKQVIEERTGIALEIDSETGEVGLNTETAKEPVLGLKVIDVVRAIGRGFSPERAFRLFNEDVYLRGFDIRDYSGKSSKHVRRLRARIIGSKGKTRRIIEELSNAEISIYGNTIYIIGDLEEMAAAESAVDMLLSGSEHATVYHFLENKRREMKVSRLDSIETQ